MNSSRIFFIIDDDIDDQELFMEAVNEVDGSIRCLASSNCDEALDMLKSGTISLPDIIFLDLNMPRLNGKQCLVEIKKEPRLKDIPVIIYSTSSEKRDIEETSRLGAAHFLTKPNKFEELCRTLSDVVKTDWRVVTSAENN